MNERARWSVLVLAAVVLSGCGSPAPAASDGGPVGGPLFDPALFCRSLAVTKCDYFKRCHSEAGAQNVRQGRPNDQLSAAEVNACIQWVGSDPGCLEGAEGWRDNRARLNIPAYAACAAAAYPSNTCVRDLNQVLALCQQASLTVSRTPAGGLCVTDQECLTGFCTANGAAACGVCQGFLTVGGGQNCDRDRQCDPAVSYCPGSDTTPGNGSGPCAAYIALGQNCDASPFTNPDLEGCSPGNVCAVSGVFRTTCIPGKALGAGCTKQLVGSECLRTPKQIPQSLCATVAVDGGTADLCVNTQARPGGDCSTGEYGGPYCVESEYCAGNTCVPRKSGGLCNGDGECADGLRCVGNGGNRTCQAYVDVGGSCTADSQCKNLLSCAANNVCDAGFTMLGRACGASVACAEGYCDAGNCVALQAVGAGCDPAAGNSCASFICAAPGGGNPTCQVPCWR